MCEEMIKLRQMLDDAGINWVDASDEIDMGFKLCFIHRTRFEINGNQYSVINGYGTYGGYYSFGPVNEGLLEIMGEGVNNGEPLGWLTAEEVLKEVGVIK